MRLPSETIPRTVPVSELLHPRNVHPFYVTAGVWLLVGSFASGDPKWFLVLASAVCLDLFLLLKVVATLLVFVSHKRSGETVSSPLVAFWFAAKLVGFSVLLAVLLVSRKAPFQAVLWGLGTFAIVPLIGGLMWGRKNLKPESSNYAW